MDTTGNKGKLVDRLFRLATLNELRTERLNKTSARCIDMAGLCLKMAAEYDLQIVSGKNPTLEMIREARQWIKQALDADQKNIDQEANEALSRLEEQEAATAMASHLQ